MKIECVRDVVRGRSINDDNNRGSKVNLFWFRFGLFIYLLFQHEDIYVYLGENNNSNNNISDFGLRVWFFGFFG